MAVTLDSLDLQIMSDASHAVRQIERLTGSLKVLSGVAKGALGQLSGISSRLQKIANDTKAIGGIKKIEDIMKGVNSQAAESAKIAGEKMPEIKIPEVVPESGKLDEMKKDAETVKEYAGEYKEAMQVMTSANTVARNTPELMFARQNQMGFNHHQQGMEYFNAAKTWQGNGDDKMMNYNLERAAEFFEKERQTMQGIADIKPPQEFLDFLKQVNPAAESGAEGMKAIQESAQESSAAMQSVQATTAATGASMSEVQGAAASVKGELSGTTAAANSVADAQKEVTSTAGAAADSLRDTGDAAAEASSGFHLFSETAVRSFERIKRFMSMRALRYAIRAVTSGIGEGVENLKKYSEGINGTFARTMEQATGKLGNIKNSIATAIQPAIYALVPVLQTVASWINTACNALSQLFALLSGSKTWTRATDTVEDYSKTAKGAAKATKDLLADWDELNIIQSQNNGGGGGTTGKDYSKMFEEVSEFDKKMKKIVNWLKKNMKSVLGIAEAIGVAVGAWKFGNLFMDALQKFFHLVSAGAVIAITWQVAWLMDEKYIETGKPGWLIGDMLTSALGATLAGGIAQKILGGSAGAITASITLGISGLVTLHESKNAALQGKINEAKLLNMFGGLKLGVAAALALAGIGAGTGAAIAGGFAFGALAIGITAFINLDAQKTKSYKQMAIDAFSKAGEGGISPDEYLKALQKEFDERTKNAKLVLNAFAEVPELNGKLQQLYTDISTIEKKVHGGEALTKEEAQAFSENWGLVFDTMNQINNDSFAAINLGIADALKNENENATAELKELQNTLIEIQQLTNGSIAGAKTEMGMLANKIGAGKATDKEIERYNQLAKNLSMYTGNASAEAIQKAIDNFDRIDFGTGEQAIENAQKFVVSIETAKQEALDAVQEAVVAELKAVEEARKNLEFAFTNGDINEEQYQRGSSALTAAAKVFEEQFANESEKIKEIAGKGYQKLSDQILSAFKLADFDMNDSDVVRQMNTFVETTLTPIKDALKESGYDTSALDGVSEVIETIIFLKQRLNLADNIGNSDRTRNRSKITELFSTTGIDAIENAMHMLGITYDDLMNSMDEGGQEWLQGKVGDRILNAQKLKEETEKDLAEIRQELESPGNHSSFLSNILPFGDPEKDLQFMKETLGNIAEEEWQDVFDDIHVDIDVNLLYQDAADAMAEDLEKKFKQLDDFFFGGGEPEPVAEPDVNSVNTSSGVNNVPAVNGDAIGASVAGHLAAMFSTMNGKLSSIAASSERTANKSFVVNIGPSAALGRTVGDSLRMAQRNGMSMV